VGEDGVPMGAGHAGHLFCSDRIVELMGGKNRGSDAGSSTETQIVARAMLLECAADARSRGVALREFS